MPTPVTKTVPKVSPLFGAKAAAAAAPAATVNATTASQPAYAASQGYGQAAPSQWYNPATWFGGKPMQAAESGGNAALALIKEHPIAAAGAAIGVILLGVKAFGGKK